MFDDELTQNGECNMKLKAKKDKKKNYKSNIKAGSGAYITGTSRFAVDLVATKIRR